MLAYWDGGLKLYEGAGVFENAPMWFGHSIKQYEAKGEKWYE
jgi:hypothetical protein